MPELMASEAYKIAQKADSPWIKHIRYAAENGDFELKICGFMSEQEEDYLTLLGYKVKRATAFNELNHISWR